MSKNYEVWLEEDTQTVCLKTYRTMTAEDVHELMSLADKEFAGKEINYCLIDMSEATSEPIPKETRQAFKEYAESISYKKVAIIVTNPITRMLAKVALVVTGKPGTSRFFGSSEEARAWLKE
ncbi:STAS/SEC14 domain-containing protein [candidate division WOR-3 bacterium]|nr:STAS/SEC14 domain-containing protein [candidate division WOR-3 bacterium]